MSDERRILGQEFLKTICPAIGVDVANVRRVVIDAEYGEAVKIYVENIGDSRLLKVEWAGHLQDTKVIRDESDSKS